MEKGERGRKIWSFDIGWATFLDVSLLDVVHGARSLSEVEGDQRATTTQVAKTGTSGSFDRMGWWQDFSRLRNWELKPGKGTGQDGWLSCGHRAGWRQKGLRARRPRSEL